jgi:hypothetical protein
MSRISDQVSQADDIETELVDIPEWGVKIAVRSMDGVRRSQFMTDFTRARENEDDSAAVGKIEADLIVACCFDPEDNSQAFTIEDIPMLLSKSGAVLGRLSRIASKLSGLSAEDEAEQVKNS